MYKILVGKPEGKRSLRRHRWKDNIEVHFKENRIEGYGLDSCGSG
jgi:hypothetical protein